MNELERVKNSIINIWETAAPGSKELIYDFTLSTAKFPNEELCQYNVTEDGNRYILNLLDKNGNIKGSVEIMSISKTSMTFRYPSIVNTCNGFIILVPAKKGI